MATSSDALLLRAMTQFGGGLGSMMGRRRQNRQNEELFANMFPSDAQAPQVTTPGTQDLTSAMLGTIPGMGAAATGLNAAMIGAQGQIDASTAQRNQGNARMQQMAKDPQMAAMLKQGIAQSQMASMMPKKPFSGAVTGGYVDEKGNFVRTEQKKPQDFSKNYSVEQIGDEDVLLHYSEDGAKELARAPRGSFQPMTIREGENERSGVLNKNTGDFTPMGKPGLAGKSHVTTQDMTSMPKPVQGQIQSNLKDSQQALRNFNDMEESFQGKFLQGPYKGLNALRSVAIKFGGKGLLSDAQIKEHGEAAVFYQDTWRTVNEYIRAITGAQMNQAEVPRLMRSIANTTDDEVAFMAKLKNSMEMARGVDTEMRAYLKEGRILDTEAFNDELDRWGDRYTNADDTTRTAIENVAREKAAQKWAMDQISFRWDSGGVTGGGEDLGDDLFHGGE